jgi:hypothetical protein
MKMYRVYYNQREAFGGSKSYLCERPGYWCHWSSSPEDCLPFTQEQAEKTASWNTAHCGDVDGECCIEEYEEIRPLSTNSKGDYRASWYTRLLMSGVWKPVIA